MTSTEPVPEYYFISEDGAHVVNRRSDYYPNNFSNESGISTSRTRYGDYNIIEKDFGGHKTFNYIPVEYSSRYEPKEFDENSYVIEKKRGYRPGYARRRYYETYDDYDDDYDYEDIEYEEVSPRTVVSRNIYVSPQPRLRKRIIENFYYDTSPPLEINDYRLKEEEPVQHIVYEHSPRQRQYIEEPPTPRYVTKIQSLPPVVNSPRLTNISHVSPAEPLHFSRFSPLSHSKYGGQSSRTTIATNRQIRTKINLPNKTSTQPHISLREVIARNRARRGPNIPKPRREVDEEKPYDPPTYHRNFIKNDFLVHK